MECRALGRRVPIPQAKGRKPAKGAEAFRRRNARRADGRLPRGAHCAPWVAEDRTGWLEALLGRYGESRRHVQIRQAPERGADHLGGRRGHGAVATRSARRRRDEGAGRFRGVRLWQPRAGGARAAQAVSESPLIFAADDDWQTEGNPGRSRAAEISGQLGRSTVCWPTWVGAREPGWTDFNDLHASAGLEEVRQQLQVALRRVAQGISTPKGASAKVVDEADAWREQLLVRRGQLVDCRENVFRILTMHPEWRGVVAFDEFANRVVKRRPPPWGREVGEWTEADDARVGVWFVDRMGYSIKALGNIMSAVMLAGEDARFHPVREQLAAIEWDQRARLDTWCVDFLGCRHSEYVRLVGRFFLLNMIARVMDPGCIMRAVPVLEGPQERGKSTALSILGGEFFSDTPFRVGESDACLAIQGVWVYEIGEMQQFGKAEAAAVKQFVSSRVDHYRPPYGRRHINVPRQTVFAGSINEAQYLRDWTGNTRFHPIRCVEEREIDLGGLQACRDQLLAEALVLHRQGARRYPTREEAETLFAPEQEARMQEAAWEGLVLEELGNTTYKTTTVHRILVEIVKVDAARITDKMMADVGRILSRAGWVQSRPMVNGRRQRVYTRPPEPMKPLPAAKPDGDLDDIPF
jgi:putative DNA primase/helicase